MEAASRLEIPVFIWKSFNIGDTELRALDSYFSHDFKV